MSSANVITLPTEIQTERKVQTCIHHTYTATHSSKRYHFADWNSDRKKGTDMYSSYVQQHTPETLSHCRLEFRRKERYRHVFIIRTVVQQHTPANVITLPTGIETERKVQCIHHTYTATHPANVITLPTGIQTERKVQTCIHHAQQRTPANVITLPTGIQTDMYSSCTVTHSSKCYHIADWN